MLARRYGWYTHIAPSPLHTRFPHSLCPNSHPHNRSCGSARRFFVCHHTPARRQTPLHRSAPRCASSSWQLHASDLSTPDRATVAARSRKEFQTPLCIELIHKIRAQGYFPLAQFVKDCLGHPHHGYYVKKPRVIGTESAADFITAAEISLFGDVLAAWVMDTWQKMGTPRVCHLIELGPGKGTLMRTMLRQIQFAHPQVLHFMRIHLVEMGAARQEEQKAALAEFQTAAGRIRWYMSLDALPAMSGEASIFIGNEYLDALPVAQFRYTERGWVETCVEVDEDVEREAHFHLVHAPSGSASAFLIPDEVRARPWRASSSRASIIKCDSPHRHAATATTTTTTTASTSATNNVKRNDSDAVDNTMSDDSRKGKDETSNKTDLLSTSEDGAMDCVEVNVVAMQQMEMIMKRMVDAQCSACVLIDYGKDEHMSNTLRGIRGHRFVDPLLSPGEVDLSCWVSFRQLRWALERLELARRHLRWFPVCTQREFLQYNGIDVRLAQVIKDKDTKSAMKILQNYRRLMDVTEMGESYKVFAFQTRNFASVSPFFADS